MNKQLGTVAWPSPCVELANISHPPVLAGTQQARCSAPCPPRRPASAPFPAAAGSPTTSPCVALPPPRHRTVVSAHVPVCLPAVPWRRPHYSAVTPCTRVLSASTPELLLYHVLAPPTRPTCPSHAGTHATQVHGVHTCHVRSSAPCTPTVPHICSCSHQAFGSSTPTWC